jgi:hypothetical protein
MGNEFFDAGEFEFDLEKSKFIKNIDYLKSMSAEEQTFYKKWVEVQTYKDYLNKSGVVKAKIWTPTDINNIDLTIKELENLNPTIVHVTAGSPYEHDWLMLRLFCHTMEYAQTPGRFIKLLITDGNVDNPRYLGAVSISSDVIVITDRDDYIGWTADNKLKDKRLVHSAIGSCIMSTQPFGYNFLGGKLVAALITTSKTREIWKKLYDEELVGMTTTSLYGSYSMYNSLKWWHKCGSSTGKMMIKPDDSVYEVWHQWIKDNRTEQYNKAMTQKEGVSGPVTGAKTRVINMIFQTLGIKSSDYTHGYERGVYYSCFYENTKEFLQNKITEKDLKLKELFKKDVQGVLDWWKPKAIERYKKLHGEGNIKSDILYYNKMMGMTYDDAKSKFFNEVGR